MQVSITTAEENDSGGNDSSGDNDDDDDSKIIGAVVGSVFGVLILAFLVLLGLFIAKRKGLLNRKSRGYGHVIPHDSARNKLGEPFLPVNPAIDHLWTGFDLDEIKASIPPGLLDSVFWKSLALNFQS